MACTLPKHARRNRRALDPVRPRQRRVWVSATASRMRFTSSFCSAAVTCIRCCAPRSLGHYHQRLAQPPPINGPTRRGVVLRATSTAPSTVTEAEEATLEPQGTPTIEEALLQFTACQRLRVTVQMRWGQAPATIYADDPKVWGNLEEGDYVQFISGVQDNGVVHVKVFPHDGRAVGNTNDQVWIDWKGLTQNRLDQHALECEIDTRSMLGHVTLVVEVHDQCSPHLMSGNSRPDTES